MVNEYHVFVFASPPSFSGNMRLPALVFTITRRLMSCPKFHPIFYQFLSCRHDPVLLFLLFVQETQIRKHAQKIRTVRLLPLFYPPWRASHLPLCGWLNLPGVLAIAAWRRVFPG